MAVIHATTLGVWYNSCLPIDPSMVGMCLVPAHSGFTAWASVEAMRVPALQVITVNK